MFFLHALPSYTQHLQHIHNLHCGEREKPHSTPAPKITESTQPIMSPAVSPNTVPGKLIDLPNENSFLNTIKTTFTPLLAHYYFEKIIPQDPLTKTLEEQLEYTHMVSTFITRLNTLYDALTKDVRMFMKTPFAQEQSITKLITKIIVCLQSYYTERKTAYKNLKPSTNNIKELKKLTITVAKELDLVCKKILDLNPHEI